MFNNFFFEKRAVYEIMWKNIVELDRPRLTVWRMRIACWIPKAANTHSDSVMFSAFPVQQRLHERASLLCYAHIACLFYFKLQFAVYCENVTKYR
jgi:hypothetical protein